MGKLWRPGVITYRGHIVDENVERASHNQRHDSNKKNHKVGEKGIKLWGGEQGLLKNRKKEQASPMFWEQRNSRKTLRG